MQIQSNISLKAYNTFGVNVRAKFFCIIRQEEELLELLHHPLLSEEAVFILGEGSDVLFTKDFDGLIIKDELKGIEQVHENDDHVWIKAASGENWHQFVEHCVKQNLGGIENLALIPGTVGAAPIQNIGAYGSELKDSMHSLEAIDMYSGNHEIFMNEECEFDYRWSFFKKPELRSRYYITSVTFRLSKKPCINMNYTDVQQLMQGKEASISNVFDSVVEIRRKKLPDPKELGNAGSFFKNPVVEPSFFEQLKQRYPELKSFAAGDKIKLAAAQLIDMCGWKEVVENNTTVYKNQALVIVNLGGAKGKDIHNFSLKIQESVYHKFGLKLEAEVNIL